MIDNYRGLAVFVAVADAGSLSAAGRRLKLSDSRLESRRIADFRRVLVASVEYVASRRPLETLEDLASCDFIAISMLPDAVNFECEGRSVSFHPENVRLEADTIGSAKSAVLAGLGVRHLPLGEVEQELASGSLVRILPQWNVPDLGVYAVWPDVDPEKALTRHLIDHFLHDNTSHRGRLEDPEEVDLP